MKNGFHLKLVYIDYSFMQISKLHWSKQLMERSTRESTKFRLNVIYRVSESNKHKLMSIRFISFLFPACFA